MNRLSLKEELFRLIEEEAERDKELSLLKLRAKKLWASAQRTRSVGGYHSHRWLFEDFKQIFFKDTPIEFAKEIDAYLFMLWCNTASPA